MKKWLSGLILLAVFLLFSSGFVLAESEADKLDRINNDINQFQNRLNELYSAKKTLANQIAQMDYQVQLTALKIKQTQNLITILEEQVTELSTKIGKLDLSLNRLSAIFMDRVVATYKNSKTDPFSLFISSNTFSDFFRRWKYFRILQINDRKVMISLEEARLNYDRQKQEKEEKQQELEGLKKQLDNQRAALVRQKKDKEHLLAVTKNDEKKYQQLLNQALAELEAIQAIIAGKGDESEVADVSQGERIASIISGSSPCSTGTHLHFEVRQGGAVQNPFSYLSSVQIENKSGGDSYSFGGNWPWPITPPVELNQGFGSDTWWVRSGLAPYRFHSGIDIVSGNSEVRAVKEGKLYNGSVKCGGGTLRYVRVKHKDSDISTYYLHVNYAKI